MKTLMAIIAVASLSSSLNLRPDQLGSVTWLGAPPSEQRRETVLDHHAHIETAILDVPNLRPPCKELQLNKRGVNVGDCALECEIAGKGLPLVVINGVPGGTCTISPRTLSALEGSQKCGTTISEGAGNRINRAYSLTR
jgi:hypothetical protein